MLPPTVAKQAIQTNAKTLLAFALAIPPDDVNHAILAIIHTGRLGCRDALAHRSNVQLGGGNAHTVSGSLTRVGGVVGTVDAAQLVAGLLVAINPCRQIVGGYAILTIARAQSLRKTWVCRLLQRRLHLRSFGFETMSPYIHYQPRRLPLRNLEGVKKIYGWHQIVARA